MLLRWQKKTPPYSREEFLFRGGKVYAFLGRMDLTVVTIMIAIAADGSETTE
jgi:hypothetical protein